MKMTMSETQEQLREQIKQLVKLTEATDSDAYFLKLEQTFDDYYIQKQVFEKIQYIDELVEELQQLANDI